MQNDAQARFTQQQDFAVHVVSTVRIPNVDDWLLKGFMASQSYLFPKQEMDDTYKQLQSPDVADLAAKTESNENLQSGVLGRVALYADA